MFDSIVDDLKAYFRTGNMVSKLIIINAIVFVVLILVKIGIMFTGPGYPELIQKFTRYLAIHEDMIWNLKHPWVFVTHAFVHFGFFHILWNMLLLLWFGRIVGDLLGDHRILPIYTLGALAGIVFFWISAAYIFPGYQIAYGASAAVMAIIVAAGFTSPDYIMHLILIGPVRIKYIVLVLLILDLLAISNMDNTGGHIAHIGGAIMGGLFVFLLRNDVDLGEPINRFYATIGGWFTPSERSVSREKSPLTVSFKAKEKKSRAGRRTDDSWDVQSSSDRLDEILEKIKEKGINSLTSEERKFLEEQSKKN